jgi:hypothetical protein
VTPALLLVAAALLAGPREAPGDAAVQRVTQAAQRRGASEAEVKQAVAALKALADAGLPVSHALQVVTSALELKGGRPDLGAVARAVDEAHRRGASSHELVNLTEDLARSGVDTPGLLDAIEAVGRLAEDGYTDAETRRGVAATVLHRLEEGARGRDLAETVRQDARDGKENGGGQGAGGNNGQGHSEEARDKDKEDNADVRDELRHNPPKGLPEGKGPAGVPERQRDNNGNGPGNNPGNNGNNGNGKDKDDKGKPDNPGGGKK